MPSIAARWAGTAAFLFHGGMDVMIFAATFSLVWTIGAQLIESTAQ